MIFNRKSIETIYNALNAFSLYADTDVDEYEIEQAFFYMDDVIPYRKTKTYVDINFTINSALLTIIHISNDKKEVKQCKHLRHKFQKDSDKLYRTTLKTKRK